MNINYTSRTLHSIYVRRGEKKAIFSELCSLGQETCVEVRDKVGRNVHVHLKINLQEVFPFEEKIRLCKHELKF